MKHGRVCGESNILSRPSRGWTRTGTIADLPVHRRPDRSLCSASTTSPVGSMRPPHRIRVPRDRRPGQKQLTNRRVGRLGSPLHKLGNTKNINCLNKKVIRVKVPAEEEEEGRNYVKRKRLVCVENPKIHVTSNYLRVYFSK